MCPEKIIPKILRRWTATEMFLVRFVPITSLGSNLTIVLITSIPVIKYNNRCSCGLFNI